MTWLRKVSKLFACKFGRRMVRLVAAEVCAGLSGLKAIQFLCDRQQPSPQRGVYQQLERNHNGGRKAPYKIKKAVPEPRIHPRLHDSQKGKVHKIWGRKRQKAVVSREYVRINPDEKKKLNRSCPDQKIGEIQKRLIHDCPTVTNLFWVQGWERGASEPSAKFSTKLKVFIHYLSFVNDDAFQ